tara:strand:- start:1788 stop:2249 length:462 start_codon:yes stop_codon:yes gene_type:complete
MINLEKKNLVRNIVAYVVAFCTAFFLVVFLFRIPFFLFGKSANLVQEYHITRFIPHTIYDCLGVLVSLLLSKYIYDNYLEDTKIPYNKILSVVLVPLVISGLFCYYAVNTNFKEKSLYTKWYKESKEFGVLYDIIYILSTYLIFEFIHNKLNN